MLFDDSHGMGWIFNVVSVCAFSYTAK